MNVLFTADLTLGVVIGVFITILAIYLSLQIENQTLFSRALTWLGKSISHSGFSTLVTTGTPIRIIKNAGKDSKPFDIKRLLALYLRYKQEPYPELREEIRKHLRQHFSQGNNALHEYLSREYSQYERPKLEVVKKMLELEPGLLLEANAEGNTPLQIAEQHEHIEIAEFLIDTSNFANLSYRYEFLKHLNHNGNTVLHDAAHLWHYHPEHFLKMIERCPLDALFWKDKRGKTVLEHFLANRDADRKVMLDMLVHKGILRESNGRLEVPSQVRTKIWSKNHEYLHNLSNFAELLVNDYPHFIHRNKIPASFAVQAHRGSEVQAH